MKTAIDVQANDYDTDTACNLCPPNSDESSERTMNLKKALKKTKAALEHGGSYQFPKNSTEKTVPKESQKKTVVECLEDIEEIDTR